MTQVHIPVSELATKTELATKVTNSTEIKAVAWSESEAIAKSNSQVNTTTLYFYPEA